MSKPEPVLEKGKFFHIYNRGINGCNLFSDAQTYEHFLGLYQKYIPPVADTYAWVLMPNHFHFLVRIKENVVYKYSPSSNADRCFAGSHAVRFKEGRFDDLKWETIDISDSKLNLSAREAPDSVGLGKIPNATHHFSHLFNAYSKYFNNFTGRHGSLFERPFDRKEIDNTQYFKRMVLYIHNNPVHHKFVENAMDYPWSSYLTFISTASCHIQHDAVIGWFDGQANFETAHEDRFEDLDFEKWLGLE